MLKNYLQQMDQLARLQKHFKKHKTEFLQLTFLRYHKISAVYQIIRVAESVIIRLKSRQRDDLPNGRRMRKRMSSGFVFFLFCFKDEF